MPLAAAIKKEFCIVKKIAISIILLTLACADKPNNDQPKWVSNPSAWDTETCIAIVGHAEGADDEISAILLASHAALDGIVGRLACDEIDCTAEDNMPHCYEQWVIPHSSHDSGITQTYEAYILLLIPRKILKDSTNASPSRGIKT